MFDLGARRYLVQMKEPGGICGTGVDWIKKQNGNERKWTEMNGRNPRWCLYLRLGFFEC
jgi:hypothetical protein